MQNAFVVLGVKGAKAYVIKNEKFIGYMLPNGKNFHLSGISEVIKITYEEGGVLNQVTISNNQLSVPESKGFYEESAHLTGKAINRVRDKLTITEIK